MHSNILLDPGTGLEIPFSRPFGTALIYTNEVVDYIRSRDNRTVSWVSSAGAREIEFQIQTNVSPQIERQLDYFRTSEKYILLFIPSLSFASEIVISNVDLVEIISTHQTFSIKAYCFGIEGICLRSIDSGMTGSTTTTIDSGACSNPVTTLINASEYLSMAAISVDKMQLEAGTYTVWVRAKSSAGTTNDMTISVVDNTSGSLVSGSRTVASTGYAWYGLNVTVPDASLGHTINVEAIKATTGTNTLYIDSISIVRASGLITV